MPPYTTAKFRCIIYVNRDNIKNELSKKEQKRVIEIEREVD